MALDGFVILFAVYGSMSISKTVDPGDQDESSKPEMLSKRTRTRTAKDVVLELVTS